MKLSGRYRSAARATTTATTTHATGTRTSARSATRTAAVVAATALSALALTGATAGTAAAAPTGAANGSAVRPVADPCHHSSARPTLRQGDTGPAVKQAQCYLLHTLIIDDIIEVDGDFDAETALRVRQFQSCTGLPANGVVGAETWSVFEEYVSSGRVC
ncbi:peptidoglycan-binding protein [Streptomyces sp. Amel2xB2]|uniref:peptidoglycan-binding domain-containing protein n=1 Tax=Streptomyces sp. Amel2xB2 TaxID=1305829 RepID=UPI0015EB4291|nr:peptidoglycan-binding domain-containing protein [Streptomyces sp. Amel2xB2]